MAISLDTRIIPLGNTKSNLGILGEKIKRKAVRVRGDYSGITGIALDLGEAGGGESGGEQSLTITSAFRTTIDKKNSSSSEYFS